MQFDRCRSVCLWLGASEGLSMELGHETRPLQSLAMRNTKSKHKRWSRLLSQPSAIRHSTDFEWPVFPYLRSGVLLCHYTDKTQHRLDVDSSGGGKKGIYICAIPRHCSFCCDEHYRVDFYIDQLCSCGVSLFTTTSKTKMLIQP
jgi:hypothetical protein